MTYFGLGVITLTGSPINVSTLLTSTTEFNVPVVRVAKVLFQPLVGNSAVSYVGNVGFNKATGAGVIKQMNVQASTGKMDVHCLCSPGAADNAVFPRDYAVDGASGDKVIVSIGLA